MVIKKIRKNISDILMIIGLLGVLAVLFSCHAWMVYSDGHVSNTYNSVYANRCAPACVIC